MNKISLLLLILVLSCTDTERKESNSDKLLKINDTFDIFDYNLTSVNNKEIEKGKLLLLDFWATWCGPCIASFPHLEQLQEKYHKDIQIIAISDEKVKTVTDFLSEKKVNLSFLNNLDKQLFTHLNIKTRPVSCLISKKGKLLWVGNSEDFEPILIEYLKSGIIPKQTVNESNKKYYTNDLDLKKAPNIYQYSLSEATNPKLYSARTQKNEDEPIDIKYISIPIIEVLQDFLQVDYLNLINNRPELDTILINIEAKSRKLTYGQEKEKILNDIQNVYNFNIRKENRTVDGYFLKVLDSITLNKNIETIKGGGVVKRKNGQYIITRLNLSQIASYFQKKLKVHIQYNGMDSSKYNLVVPDFGNLNELNSQLNKYGLSLSQHKQKIEFIEIN
jgi:thiol-disulfide isomerase/thioredoxin